MKRAVLFFSFFSLQQCACAQLDAVIRALSQKTFVVPERMDLLPLRTGNALEDSLYEIRRKTSASFYYYQMDSLVSETDLVNLAGSDSPAVQSYAAYALSFRDTLILPGVLQKMLDHAQPVSCSFGCISMDELTASCMFYGLYTRMRKTGLPSPDFLDRLDAVFMTHKNATETDIYARLDRLRSKSMNPLIERLALERHSLSAISYLQTWYRAEYSQLLNRLNLQLLDSDIVTYGYPGRISFIQNLLELKNDSAIQKLGSWLKSNRPKWTNLRNIDKIIDGSTILQDSIGWHSARYPLAAGEADFLNGEWTVKSGMDAGMLKTSDTIIFERVHNLSGHHLKISFELIDESLYMDYFKDTGDKHPAMVGTPMFNAADRKINFDELNWDWYKIFPGKDRLILIRESVL